MKKVLLIMIVAGPHFPLPAVADMIGERHAVVNLVQEFFDAMTARDVERMRSLLTADGIFYGYREDADGLSIVRRTHQAYVDGLAGGDSELIERFWDPQVLLHDRMAVVWNPYDLYIDGQFSHCGIDNFTFLKTDQGWQITGILFSMETDGCAESPLESLQD